MATGKPISCIFLTIGRCKNKCGKSRIIDYLDNQYFSEHENGKAEC